MVFKSRVQWTLFAPIFLLLLGIGIHCIVQGVWIIMIINLIVMFYLVHMMLTTDYTITEDVLLVRSGILFRTTIPIRSVTKIKPTNDIMSAPALSVKGRLMLFYGRSQSLIVSPAQQVAFLEALLAVNSEISV